MQSRNGIFAGFYLQPRYVALRQTQTLDSEPEVAINEIIAILCNGNGKFNADTVLIKWQDARGDLKGEFDTRLLDRISMLGSDEKETALKNLYMAHENNSAFSMMGLEDVNILKEAALLACDMGDVMFFETMFSIDEAKKEVMALKMTPLSLSPWEYSIMMNAFGVVKFMKEQGMVPKITDSKAVDDFAVFVSSRDNDKNRYLRIMDFAGRLHIYNPTWRYLPTETPLVDRDEPLADLVVRKSRYENMLRLITETHEFVELRAAFNKIRRTAPKSVELIEAAVVNEINELKRTDVQATLFFIAEAVLGLDNESDREYTMIAICSGLITHTSHPPLPNADSAAYIVAEFAATTNNAAALRVLLEDYRTSRLINKEHNNKRCISEHALLATAGDAFKVARQLHTCPRCTIDSLRATIKRVSRDGEDSKFDMEAKRLLESAASVVGPDTNVDSFE